MYLNSFNYFRGIAIVFIVAGHCLYMSGWAIDSVGEKFIANLVLGGTSLFVFISGFLFHHIYYSRFNYKKFMLTKVKNVLVPYLVLSLPLVLYSVLVKGNGPYGEYFFSREPGIYSAYIQPVIGYLWTGRLLEAYWYIPFIMVVFTASPLIMFYIRLRPVSRLIILLVLLAVALFVQRPIHNISVLQSVVYFLPVYLFGIIVSIHRETIYTHLHGREGYLLAVVILLALLQSMYYTYFGNLHKLPFQFRFLDLMLLQKLFLCLFFMVVLNRFEKVSVSALETLAAASFAIYFIHPHLLMWMQILLLNKGYQVVRMMSGPFLWLVMTSGIILLSIGIALVIRRVFRSHSRSLIGW